MSPVRSYSAHRTRHPRRRACPRRRCPGARSPSARPSRARRTPPAAPHTRAGRTSPGDTGPAARTRTPDPTSPTPPRAPSHDQPQPAPVHARPRSDTPHRAEHAGRRTADTASPAPSPDGRIHDRIAQRPSRRASPPSRGQDTPGTSRRPAPPQQCHTTHTACPDRQRATRPQATPARDASSTSRTRAETRPASPTCRRRHAAGSDRILWGECS